MYLSIITVNYNSSDKAVPLLKSLKDQIDQDFKVFVVDNASEKDDFDRINELAGGNIETIRNDKNLGFSGGNNIGIRQALRNGSEWVLLLNIDTQVERGFISDLKAVLRLKRGIVGVPLVEGDRVAYRGKIGWLKHTLRHTYNPQYSEYLERNSKYYVIGGAEAIHKDVFAKIGFWDEKYFLYFEDADFSLRAEKAGFPVTFLEEPKAYHQVSAVTKKLGTPMLLRYHYRNSLYFNLKNGPWHIKALVWPWSFWILKKQLFKVFFMYQQDKSLAILMGVVDFYKGKMGKIV